MIRRLGCGHSSFVLLSLLALCAAGAASSCSSSRPIVVGGLVSETGAAGAYGKSVRAGMDLALEEVNAGGGLPNGRHMQIEYRDDGSSPDKAKTAARDLIDNKRASVVIGGVSSAVAIELVPQMREKEVVLLSPSASSSQLSATGGGWFFRIYPSDMAEGEAMGVLALKLDLPKVAVLAWQDPFAQGIADIFTNQFQQEKGRAVALREDFASPLSPGHAKELAQKVIAARAENVYLAGYIEDVSTLLQALQSAGYKGVKMATSAVDPNIVGLAGVASERLVFPQLSFDLKSGEADARRFVEAYKKKYNRDPETFAAYGYDAVKVVAEAIRKTGMATAAEIREQLAKLDTKGVTGEIKFDQRGDVRREPHLFVVVKGELAPFDSMDPGIRGILVP